MAKKKSTNNTKKTGPTEPKSGLVDQIFLLLEKIFSYFELLFVYYRKKFNIGVRRTILILISLIYFLALFFTASGMLIHAGYLGLQIVYSGNAILSSLTMGGILFFTSFIVLYILIRKVIF